MKSRKFPNISICIPVYNEEDFLLKGIAKIQTSMAKLLGSDNFEIVVVENGSTDNTPKLINQIKQKNVRAFSVKTKGIGAAYRKAIQKSKYDCVVLSSIDLPFGVSDLKNFLLIWEEHDLVFGSKAHRKSKLNTTLKRNLASNIYRFFLKLFFNLKVKDSQGTMFLKKSKILQILKYCDSNNAFFTAQLAIYGKLHNLKITEVPVSMVDREARSSKYGILKDGRAMLLSLLKERLKLANSTS